MIKLIIIVSIVSFQLMCFPLNAQLILTLPKVDSSNNISPSEELQSDLFNLIEQDALRNSFIGVHIESIKGDTLFSYNSDKNFIPASNQKIFTIATALRYLGKDYKFQTKLYLDGTKDKNGKFSGNIIIRGFGDPTHSPRFSSIKKVDIFEFIANVLDSMGIKKISGNIIGDDNFFDDRYYCPGWQIDDKLYSYNAPISALSYNANSIDLCIKPAKDSGEVAQMEITPNTEYLVFNNNLITSFDKYLIEIKENEGTNIINISGFIPLDSMNICNKYSISIDNPTQFFLYSLKDYLQNKGIQIKGAILDIDDLQNLLDYSTMKKVYTFYSPELNQILPIINKNSYNLETEMILKVVARETTGFGSTSNGIEKVIRYIKKVSKNNSSISMVDGSGLSRLNTISPFVIVKFLKYLVLNTRYRADFMKTLAVPGDEGTLKRRLNSLNKSSNLYAKTGTMKGISAFSGYVDSRDSEKMIFSIMILNHTLHLTDIQNLQDIIVMRLAAFTRNPELYPTE